MNHPRRDQLGPYRIVRTLGEGAMGAVFEGEHRETGARHALKLIIEGAISDEEAFERFTREARLVARLDHPHVVRIHSAQLERSPRYLALDLHGGSLDRRLERGPLDPEEARVTTLKLAGAVAHAHAQGVLHRDLKPANVLYDEAGEPLLTDFGLGRGSNQRRLTLTGDILGSPVWMSPEQAMDSKRTGVGVDVYGLGALLYAMLTGEPPVRPAATLIETFTRVCEEPPLAPSKLRSGVPPLLEAVCLRALAKDPRERYPTAQALVDALDALGADEASDGRPGFVVPLVTGLGALIVLLVVAIGVLATREPASPQPSEVGAAPERSDPPTAAGEDPLPPHPPGHPWLRAGSAGHLTLSVSDRVHSVHVLASYTVRPHVHGVEVALIPRRLRVWHPVLVHQAYDTSDPGRPQGILGAKIFHQPLEGSGVVRIDTRSGAVRCTRSPFGVQGGHPIMKELVALLGTLDAEGMAARWQGWLALPVGVDGAPRPGAARRDAEGRLRHAVLAEGERWWSLRTVDVGRPERTSDQTRWTFADGRSLHESRFLARNGVEAAESLIGGSWLLELPRADELPVAPPRPPFEVAQPKDLGAIGFAEPYGAPLGRLLPGQPHVLLEGDAPGWRRVLWASGDAWVRAQDLQPVQAPATLGIVVVRSGSLNARGGQDHESSRLGSAPRGFVVPLTRGPQGVRARTFGFGPAMVAPAQRWVKVCWGSRFAYMRSSVRVNREPELTCYMVMVRADDPPAWLRADRVPTRPKFTE